MIKCLSCGEIFYQLDTLVLHRATFMDPEESAEVCPECGSDGDFDEIEECDNCGEPTYRDGLPVLEKENIKPLCQRCYEDKW